MNLKILGPILFSAMVFIIAASIKIKVLENYNAWLELPPELSLWATGILFSLAVSEETKFGGRATYEISKKSGTGIEVNYTIALPDELELSAKYVYLFGYAMMTWILTILINSHVASLIKGSPTESSTAISHWTWAAHLWNFFGFSLSGTEVGVSVRSLFEVSK